jgi:hypothetical protein
VNNRLAMSMPSLPFNAQTDISCRAVFCCKDGDICLEHGICKSFSAAPVGGSGDYIGGCTDNSYSDPACPPTCTSFGVPDIVWNPADNLWYCCGNDANNNPTCSTPTDETLQAPGPDINLAAYSLPGSSPTQPAAIPVVVSTTTAILTAQATTTALATRVSTQVSTQVSTLVSTLRSLTIITDRSTVSQIDSGSLPTASLQPSHKGISTGAATGIGIGSAVGAVALAIFALSCFCRRGRRRQDLDLGPDSVGQYPQQGPFQARDTAPDVSYTGHRSWTSGEFRDPYPVIGEMSGDRERRSG